MKIIYKLTTTTTTMCVYKSKVEEKIYKLLELASLAQFLEQQSKPGERRFESQRSVNQQSYRPDRSFSLSIK